MNLLHLSQFAQAYFVQNEDFVFQSILICSKWAIIWIAMLNFNVLRTKTATKLLSEFHLISDGNFK